MLSVLLLADCTITYDVFDTDMRHRSTLHVLLGQLVSPYSPMLPASQGEMGYLLLDCSYDLVW